MLSCNLIEPESPKGDRPKSKDGKRTPYSAGGVASSPPHDVRSPGEAQDECQRTSLDAASPCEGRATTLDLPPQVESAVRVEEFDTTGDDWEEETLQRFVERQPWPDDPLVFFNPMAIVTANADSDEWYQTALKFQRRWCQLLRRRLPGRTLKRVSNFDTPAVLDAIRDLPNSKSRKMRRCIMRGLLFTGHSRRHGKLMSFPGGWPRPESGTLHDSSATDKGNDTESRQPTVHSAGSQVIPCPSEWSA